jgi:hypothetical protein
MSEQFQQKIMEYIDAIAHSLGVATQFVFETLVKQKLIEGYVHTGILAVIWIVYLILFPKVFGWLRKSVKEKGWDEPKILSGFGIVIVSFAVIFASILALPDSLMKIFNPQYYALKDILDAVKGH